MRWGVGNWWPNTRELEPKFNEDGVQMREGNRPGGVPEPSICGVLVGGIVLLWENSSMQADQTRKANILRVMVANFLTHGENSYKY